MSFPHMASSFHLPILRQLKNNPHPSAQIFYALPSTKLSHPREESLPHSLLTILCNTFRPSCPFQHLNLPPCCCHTNPWPFLFCIVLPWPPLSEQEREIWEGREAEKKRQEEGREGSMCSVLEPGGVHPHQGVEILLQLPAFFSSVLF